MKYNLQRANGGLLWHIVDPGDPKDPTRRIRRLPALCGYAPGGRTAMGKRRGRWADRMRYDPEKHDGHGICPKCLKRYQNELREGDSS